MIQTTLALLIFLFPLAYSPGPGNMFFAAVGARFGFRASLPAHLGYHLATWIVTAAIGFGFFALMQTVPAALTILAYIGGAYILWQALALLRAAPAAEDAPKLAPQFWPGVWLMVLNPKAYVIIAAMFSQFLGAFPLPLWAQILIITTIFTLNNQIAFFVWTVMGRQIGRLFHTPAKRLWINRGFAAMLAMVTVWMLFAAS